MHLAAERVAHELGVFQLKLPCYRTGDEQQEELIGCLAILAISAPSYRKTRRETKKRTTCARRNLRPNSV
jgi:hypothetical protein